MRFFQRALMCPVGLNDLNGAYESDFSGTGYCVSQGKVSAQARNNRFQSSRIIVARPKKPNHQILDKKHFGAVGNYKFFSIRNCSGQVNLYTEVSPFLSY